MKKLVRYRKIYCTINSICNNNCINCFLSKNFKENEEILSMEKLQRAFNNIKIEEGDIIEVNGGEPTLHPQLIDILAFLRSNFPVKIVLLTNGQKLADYNYAKLISRFINDVVVTLYTLDEKIHDFITKTPGSFKKKIKALKNLNKLGVKLHIKTLIMKQTSKFIPELFKFCLSTFDNFHFNINSLHMVHGAWENRKLIGIRFQEAVPYIEKTLDYAATKAVPLSVFMPMCLIDPKYWNHFPVGFGEIIKNSISITPEGKVEKVKRLLREFIEKPDKCKTCLLAERCYWPWEGYVSFFGDDELSPIKLNEVKSFKGRYK